MRERAEGRGRLIALTACLPKSATRKFLTMRVGRALRLMWTDLVFFLHHTQLDRLWAKWQIPEGRASKYVRSAARGSHEQASLADLISMGGLAPDVRAEDIIDAQARELCYRYQHR